MLIVITVLILIFAILLHLTAKRSVYQYSCIALCGALAGLFVLLLTVIFCEDASFIQTLKAFPQRFANIVIVPIGVLGIAMFVSNISLMRHEGFRPTNMVGTFLGVICAVGTVGIYILVRLLMRGADKTGEDMLAHAAVCAGMWFFLILDYCECIMLGIIAMGYAAAKAKPRFDRDFIIIPGCSIRKDGGLLPLLKGRTNRAVRYAWEQEIATGKKVCYVPSGGQGSDEIMSEGSAMELYLLSHAAEPDEVFPEKASRNTYENFLFSKRIIDAQKENAKVAFATTNYHVLRCGMLGRMVGMDAQGIASSTKWYFWPNGFAREVVAIFSLTKMHHFRAAFILGIVSLFILSA